MCVTFFRIKIYYYIVTISTIKVICSRPSNKYIVSWPCIKLIISFVSN
jgi:hypothetical protein